MYNLFRVSMVTNEGLLDISRVCFRVLLFELFLVYIFLIGLIIDL